MKKTFLLTLASGLFLLFSCQTGTKYEYPNEPAPESFMKEVNGNQVKLFKLVNKNGIKVVLTNYGARIVSVYTPDREGRMADIALGLPSVEDYLKESMYLGCTVGRYANRIRGGMFELGGQSYTLALNNGPNTLHGGVEGFDNKVWEAEEEGNSVNMHYVSPHMEEGFPGNLDVWVKFSLTDDNELRIEYNASTDQTTVVNLTNHCYFNLGGEGSGTILEHLVQIPAGSMIPVDSTLIPTGEFMPVEGTPFDFREPHTIGERIGEDHPQLAFGLGYDHSFVLEKTGEEPGLAARVVNPATGRVLELFTTEPGVQFYCGNFMDGSHTGKSGKAYVYREGFCIEPGLFPDSPNQPAFPSAVLKPGETYTQTSVFRFGLEE